MGFVVRGVVTGYIIVKHIVTSFGGLEEMFNCDM
jgi:hypothetical protein